MLDPDQCGEKIVAEAHNADVALVFGRERTGLTNEELQKCHFHVCIPANPEYSSLNLAMAVQILCYEVREAASTFLSYWFDILVILLKLKTTLLSDRTTVFSMPTSPTSHYLLRFLQGL